MATVYSAKLFSAPAFNGGPTVQFICPMDFRVVVRTISIVWGDITASGLDAWVQTSDLTKLCRKTWAITFSDPTELGGVLISNGRWVLEPGDSLATQNQTGSCDFYCSGYLLSLP